MKNFTQQRLILAHLFVTCSGVFYGAGRFQGVAGVKALRRQCRDFYGTRPELMPLEDVLAAADLIACRFGGRFASHRGADYFGPYSGWNFELQEAATSQFGFGR